MTNPTFKGFDDVAAFGQANFDALIQTGTLCARAVEEFSREIAGAVSTSFEAGADAARAAFAAKTVKDVVEVQRGFTKTSLDTAVANWARFGELGVKLAADAASPLAARADAMAAIVAPFAR